METQELTNQELEALKIIAKKNMGKVFWVPFLYILGVFLVAFIPVKYLPRRLQDLGKSAPEDESLVSLVGLNNFLLFVLAFGVMMTIAALLTYKNNGLKKDLKDRRKKVVEGEIKYVGEYEGKPFVNLKKGSGVSVLHFDKSNYVPAKVGDKIIFEVYEHSKILIRVLSLNPKKSTWKPAEVIEVLDQCPACSQPLSATDLQCPECGLNFG